MLFESVLGNQPVKSYLTKALQEGRLPHALLFAGPSGIGKSLFATELAMHLLGSPRERIEKETHPDFHVLHPEGKSGTHSIETVREVIEEVHKASFEGKGKVFVLHDAERMQPAAANALLKTLEEPTLLTVFILITSHLESILPTIQSRCSVLRFQLLTFAEVEELLKQKGLPASLAQSAQGSIGRAFNQAELKSLEALLFPLLDHDLSYAEKVVLIEELSEAIEDEDAIQKHRKVELVFEMILMRYRDAKLREAKGEERLLFFPEMPSPRLHFASFEKLTRAVNEARLALSRNIRFSVCLERVLCLPAASVL